MKGHPGGEAHTRRMTELAALPGGARVLDMGAGAGEGVRLLRSLGLEETSCIRPARTQASTRY